MGEVVRITGSASEVLLDEKEEINGHTPPIERAVGIEAFGTNGGGYQVNMLNGKVHYGTTTSLKQ